MNGIVPAVEAGYFLCEHHERYHVAGSAAVLLGNAKKSEACLYKGLTDLCGDMMIFIPFFSLRSRVHIFP